MSEVRSIEFDYFTVSGMADIWRTPILPSSTVGIGDCTNRTMRFM